MIDKLIIYFGGHTALAKALDVSLPAVSQWVKHKKIPADRAIEIEALTGGKFKARDLTRRGRFPNERKPIRIEGDVAYVDLGRGYTTVIDAEDVEKIEHSQWGVLIKRHTSYALRSKPMSVKGKYHYLIHRLIMDAPKDMDVDHIDRDGLNNRKSNLRICTRSVNINNRSVTNVPPRHNTSGYKGVKKSQKGDKWIATATVGGKNLYLGMFDCPKEANAAYCKAVGVTKKDGGAE